MKKILIIGAILVVAVVGVGAYVLQTSLDSVVKAAVEQIGSDSTGTDVSLKEVEISPTSGYGALRGFRMSNPKGFGDGDAVRFDEVSVTLDVATVLADTVVIKEVVIDKPEVTYAIANNTSNVEEIQKNVNNFAGGGGGSSSGSSGGASDGPKFVIENIYLRNGTVAVSAPAMTDESLSAPLPEIHLTDIGKDEGGATSAQVTSEVIAAVVASAKQAVQTVDVDALLKGAGDVAGEAQQQLEKATEGLGGAGDSAGGAVEEATDSLKKLLE